MAGWLNGAASFAESASHRVCKTVELCGDCSLTNSISESISAPAVSLKRGGTGNVTIFTQGLSSLERNSFGMRSECRRETDFSDDFTVALIGMQEVEVRFVLHMNKPRRLFFVGQLKVMDCFFSISQLGIDVSQ